MVTYITAEIGINHNGSPDTARRLIDAAKLSGADAVKFQLWHHTRFPDLHPLRLSESVLLEAKALTEALDMDWYCTPFDLYSIGYLAHIGMTQWKVPSGMITNRRFLHAISGMSPTIVHLSTGGSTTDTIEWALDCFPGQHVIPYHCVTCYPAPTTDLNLASIRSLCYLTKSGLAGYSDHSGDPSVPPLAVAAGATHIECHITLDQNQDGPDHRASLDPQQFAAMVKRVRVVESIMGSGEKGPAPCEIGKIDDIRRRMAL